MAPLLMLLGILVFWLATLSLTVYGIILSFKKKWYIGAVAIVLPLFGFIVGISKAVFKKDILN